MPIALTTQQLQARYELCKENLQCFVSLRPTLGQSCRLFVEKDQPGVHLHMGEIMGIEEYVKY